MAVRHGFPTCALGVYAFRAVRWADVATGTAKLVALMGPPYGALSPGGPPQRERRMAASPCPPPPQSATAAVEAPRGAARAAR